MSAPLGSWSTAKSSLPIQTREIRPVPLSGNRRQEVPFVWGQSAIGIATGTTSLEPILIGRIDVFPPSNSTFTYSTVPGSAFVNTSGILLVAPAATGVTADEARERSLNVFANLDKCRECGTRDEIWNQRDYCLACGELLG